MKLKNGDFVFYEEEATFENGMPHIVMKVKKVKKTISEGTQFIDADGEVNHNYRVRYLFRNAERVGNNGYDGYDYVRITEDNIKLKGE